MADELIPPQIRNGGAGSVEVGGVTATPYRQVQSAEQVRTDLPSSGAAAHAAALENVFKEFSGVSSDIYNKAQVQPGALAGAASGDTGHPQYKQGLERLTAYGRAFNNAATGAYAVQAAAQADDAAARLRVQANKNPDTFATTYSAVRDAVLKNAPPEAVPMLTELYNKHLAANLAAIRGDQMEEQRQLHRQEYDVGVSRQASRVAELQGSADPRDHLEAADQQVILSQMITGGQNAGLYSEAEAQAMHVSTMRQITAQVFQTQVDRELARPDGDVITLLDNFRKAHQDNLSNPNEPAVLSEPEFQKLMADATTKIREQNLLIAMNKREGKTAEQIKYEEGDKQYTSLFLQGKLTDRLLDAAVRSGDLKAETARSLHNMINGGGGPSKSNPIAYAAITRDPGFLDMKPEEIAAHPDISQVDKLNLIKEQDRRKANWEGTQKVKDARAIIDHALKIEPGTPAALLSDAQKKAQGAAHDEFVRLMNDVDPAKRDSSATSVAQTVVKHVEQREAAEDAANLERAKQSFTKSHGPDSGAPNNPEDFKARLKWYDDQIAAARARAKGE